MTGSNRPLISNAGAARRAAPRILQLALLVASTTTTASASMTVSLFSGTFDENGDHPAPALVAKVVSGDRYRIEFGKVTALVNYPDPNHPLIAERVLRQESGAKVSCPWYLRMNGAPLGTRVNEQYSVRVDHRVVCADGTCKDMVGQPVKPESLLFGQYYLPKYVTNDGRDFGFADQMWVQTPDPSCNPAISVCGPKIEIVPIACQEFSVERLFSEWHYFDRLLITDTFRQQALTDLDVDIRKVYLTFENDRGDRANCTLPDLLEVHSDVVQIGNLRDCVLPPGNQFTMYAQSRFFLKDTLPCGKFVAKGVRQDDGTYSPDWFLGWFDCDGKQDRTPIEKQFTYSTTIDLSFTKQGISPLFLGVKQ